MKMQVRILTIEQGDRFYAEVLTVDEDERVFHATNILPSSLEAHQAARQWANNNGHQVFSAANGHTVIA